MDGGPRVSPAAIRDWIRRGGSLISIPFDQHTNSDQYIRIILVTDPPPRIKP